MKGFLCHHPPESGAEGGAGAPIQLLPSSCAVGIALDPFTDLVSSAEGDGEQIKVGSVMPAGLMSGRAAPVTAGQARSRGPNEGRGRS